MTTSAEERAKALITYFEIEYCVDLDLYDRAALETIIAQDIRQAENEKLDEAAKAFEPRAARIDWHNGPAIQRAIRSLKSKD